MEINLDSPIFVYYININGLPRQRAEEVLITLNDKFSQYTNITVWIVPADFTKIDCIFDGNKTISESVKTIYTALESIITDPSLSEFKQKMRSILLKDILNGEE